MVYVVTPQQNISWNQQLHSSPGITQPGCRTTIRMEQGNRESPSYMPEQVHWQPCSPSPKITYNKIQLALQHLGRQRETRQKLPLYTNTSLFQPNNQNQVRCWRPISQIKHTSTITIHFIALYISLFTLQFFYVNNIYNYIFILHCLHISRHASTTAPCLARIASWCLVCRKPFKVDGAKVWSGH